jgi:hypothetical protein
MTVFFFQSTEYKVISWGRQDTDIHQFLFEIFIGTNHSCKTVQILKMAARPCFLISGLQSVSV